MAIPGSVRENCGAHDDNVKQNIAQEIKWEEDSAPHKVVEPQFAF